MSSTRRSSGVVPLITSPASTSWLAEDVVDLVAVTVTLVDDLLSVGRDGLRPGDDLRGRRAQAHRAAHVGDLLLLGQQVDDRVLRGRVELRGVGALHAGDVAGELGHRHLQTQAEAQVGDLVLARVTDAT